MGEGDVETVAVAWASGAEAGVLPGRASYLGGHDAQVARCPSGHVIQQA